MAFIGLIIILPSMQTTGNFRDTVKNPVVLISGRRF